MSNEVDDLLLDIREHVKYLNEIGVETLAVDAGAVPDGLPAHVVANVPVHPSAELPTRTSPSFVRAEPVVVPPRSTGEPEAPAPKRDGSRLAALPSLTKRRPIAGSGTSPRAPASLKSENEHLVPAAPQVMEQHNALPEAIETIEQIRAEIGDCIRCPLHAGRTQVVHSTGNLDADLMFVGEAPGADEDLQGFPFVGRAGKLLTDIIAAIGYKREDVFIGNINRCRPPGNRQPLPLETAECRPFLLREVAVVRPKVIVVLGNTATQNLLDIKTPISKLRGNFQDYFGVKVMPTFHPAYLLRDPHKKREVWEDMKKVRDYLQGI